MGEVDVPHGAEPLGKVRRSKPLVLLTDDRFGRPEVVKSIAHTPFWTRRLFGRRLLGREVRALRRLDGIEGLPRLIEWRGPDAFAMTVVDGEPLSGANRDRAAADFPEQLAALAAQIHARGVVHLDLRGRRNVLVRRNGSPGVVDLGASVLTGPWTRWFSWVDRSGVLKVKVRWWPDRTSEAERRTARRHALLRRIWIFHPH
jgi:hypothetical protein